MDKRITLACLLACTLPVAAETAAAGPAAEAAVSNPAGDSAARAAETLAVAARDSGYGALDVRTEPPGAQLTVDGVAAGTTPAIVDSLTPGEHQLRMSAEGYFVKSATVLVQPGPAQEVRFTLAKPATLTVLSAAEKAAVFLNGEPAGQAPLTRTGLKPDVYEVRVVASGQQPFVAQVKLLPGANDTLRAAQAPPAPAKQEAAATRTPRRQVRKGATIAALVIFGVFAAAILIIDAAAE